MQFLNNTKEITIDFPPKSAARWGHGSPPHKGIEALLLNRLDRQTEFLKKCKSYTVSFEKITGRKVTEIDPYWDQNWFPPLDGISLYTAVAECKPGRYIEIGSGNSTKFAKLAIDQQKLTTEIVSIDPHPRAEIDQISDLVYRKGVEDVDLSLFDSLSENDIVFFDGSHRSFQNSDVTVFFLEIIPRLKTGVVVGVHDIFLPNDYPPAWLDRYYNEQYLLATYILAKGDEFKLMFGCNYMYNYQSDLVNSSFSFQLRNALAVAGKRLNGGAMWFQI